MKEDVLQIEGTVVDCLPNAMFRISVPTGLIMGHVSGRIRKNNIKILLGDKVSLEMSVYDLTKGRIVRRH